MRRKSERTASKKTKASPEKKDKPDKIKRPKTRRRKESSSSEDTVEEAVPPTMPEKVVESNPPQTSTNEASPEETNEQVWQVKTSEGDVGEIQKLKICLTRPPSTPERAERSPRSKRKHSRSASGEPSEERKKNKHRSKRSGGDSKEGSDKNPDSQGDEPESEKDQEKKTADTSEVEDFQKQEVISDNTPMSTTTEETKPSEEIKGDNENTSTSDSTNQESQSNESKENKSETQDKQSDADTTVASPKSETENSQNSVAEEEKQKIGSRQRSVSGDKSEVLEIHAEDSRLESSEIGMADSQESPKSSKADKSENDVDKHEVSIVTGDKKDRVISEDEKNTEDKQVTINKQNVVECSKSLEKDIGSSSSKETGKRQDSPKDCIVEQSTPEATSVIQEGIVHNGQATTHSNRKRRWGSRPNRITTQKSISISTDVLKDIIPDVKPVEFDEVIEEKKSSRRVEVTEKLERPVLPKIVIDNTESVEINKKENDDRDKENIKVRESNLSSNRKISIVKDHDSIIARPPSPPRHKQSNVLYITNLVRPFTLPQLKNLLQRTGRIVDNGFWIDKIKSKCYVQYETEDQAVETRHALHGVTWPVSNPKTLHVDFSTQDDFNKAKANEDTDSAQTSTIPGTVEDWLREQDLKRERGEVEKPWERKMIMREWDVGKNEKSKEKEKPNRDERFHDKRRHRTPERSPEPAKKFKKKEEEAPAKLLDDLFRKTKATPCIYWLPLSAETIAIKEEQRRQHMAEHERRLQELRRTRHRH